MRRCRFFWVERSLCAPSAQVRASCKFALGDVNKPAGGRHLLELEGSLWSVAGFGHEVGGVDGAVPQVADFGQMSPMLLSLPPAKNHV